MSREIRAGGAFIEIYIKERERLEAKLKSYEQRLHSFARGVGAAGAAMTAVAGVGLAGLSAALAGFMSRGDALDDLSQRLGVASSALQELGYAARETGASTQDLETGFLKMETLIGKAEKGQKSAIATLAKYGLSLAALKSLTPEQQLHALAEAIAGQPDQATKAAAAVELLGKSGMKLIPMLSQGKAGLEAFAAEARRLGLVQRPEDVALASKLGDQWTSITSQGQALADMIGAALGPAMETVFEATTEVLAAAIAFVDQNRALVLGVGISVLALGFFGGALLAVAGAAMIAAFALKAYTVIAAAAAAITAAILTPVGLLVTGIAAIGAVLLAGAAYWATYTEAGQAAMSQMLATVQQTMKGILDAIAAGNFALGFQIAWTGALLAFEQFRSKLLKGIAEMSKDAIKIAATLGKSLVKALMTGQPGKVATASSKRIMEIIMKPARNARDLQKELDRLTAQAAEERKAAMPDLPRPAPFEFKAPQLPQVGPQSGQFGTFNAAIAGLAGNTGALTVEQKQLEVLEEVVDELAIIRQKAEEGGLVFA